MASWTHESIGPLLQLGDPVEVIVGRARELVFQASEEGWSGPPFDPLRLADLLGVKVVPHEDVFDARLVATPRGTRIEYNPNRPAGRIRFSVAHEIGHLLFEDHADAVRHRRAAHEDGDNWQLELLCNLAAAEIIMPIGSFSEVDHANLSLVDLMVLQRRLQVSTEALMLRAARLAEVPAAAFAASRDDPEDTSSTFRIDYVTPNGHWPESIRRAGSIDSPVLRECTAVGHTSSGVERWAQSAPLRVQAVGAPPFPGQRFPRIVGLLTLDDPEVEAPERYRRVIGDATQPRGTGPRVIAHVVNDRARAWGGGFAAALKRRHPTAADDYSGWSHEHPHERVLGAVHFTPVGDGIEVANLVAQAGYGPSSKPRIRYRALRQALATLAEHAASSGMSVHLPLLGAGQAGGNWAVIEELIKGELVDRGVDVTVYEVEAGSAARATEGTLPFG
jgi:hypothetical protein